jgi:hypothetical protein
VDVVPEPLDDDLEEKPKGGRGFQNWTPEERAAAMAKAAETRARKKEEKGTPTVRLETAEPRIAPKQPRGKRQAVTLGHLDRQVLVKAMEAANMAFDYTAKPDERWPLDTVWPLGHPQAGQPHPMRGQSYYSLSKEEIEKMADAWFEVAKRYPTFGSALVQGRTFSVWGDALFTTLAVVVTRVRVAATIKANRAGKKESPDGAIDTSAFVAPTQQETPSDVGSAPN